MSVAHLLITIYHMKASVLLLWLLVTGSSCFAYKYGEHKAIGDEAYIRFCMEHTVINKIFSMEWLSNATLTTTYGDLNALSGDHVSNPLVLEEELMSPTSIARRVMAVNGQYIALGFTAAPDTKLSAIDFNYVTDAMLNLSHFYLYGKTFEDHLKAFNAALLKGYMIPGNVTGIFEKLNKTNAINMYVSLHAIALDLAGEAGKLSGSDDQKEKKLLQYALLFNGFADHFLEDAFAGGHLVVNRTVAASITNNKSLHDFYCLHGTTVVNRKSEVWKAYGDGSFNNTHTAWKNAAVLTDINYSRFTPEAERIISAVRQSLDELYDEYESSNKNVTGQSFLYRIPAQHNEQVRFFMQRFNALESIPIPYNSNLKTLFAFEPTTEMKKASQLLPYRNFIKSRIGNSLVISLDQRTFDQYYFQGIEFRVNAGSIGGSYHVNRRGGKRGTMDHWHGYTLSFIHGSSGVYIDNKTISSFRNTQVRAGIRSNLDLWVSDSRFLGLYSYSEAGFQFGRDKRFVVVPSLGLQLGSLFNINYYNMPVWLRLPAQFFLPLKLRVGTVISNGYAPGWFSAIDLDFVF